MIQKFSRQDIIDAQMILSSLFTEVSSEESALSSTTNLGVGSRILQSLRETKATFGNPANDLIRLTRRLFENLGIELTEIRKHQMYEQFDFYYMTLTVSMQPGRGVLFRRLECALDFGPKGTYEPIIQDIFPKSEWREVLNWGGGMDLMLNGNLDWGVEVSMPEIPGNIILPGPVKANIANKGGLRAFVAIPDYSFKLGRAEIASTGEGSSECFWRIEHPDLQEVQTMKFGVIFKVPKATRMIELEGIVAVEPSISWLVANIRDVFEGLNENLKNLLRLKEKERNGKERLPIGDFRTWLIHLPD